MTAPSRLVQNETPPPKTLFKRAVRRQCPICGSGGIFNGWLSLKDECPTCGYVFIREHGYFLGAMAVNVVVAELISMAILIALLIFTALKWWEVELIVLPIALGLPFLFIPYARGLWMALDITFHPKNQR